MGLAPTFLLRGAQLVHFVPPVKRDPLSEVLKLRISAEQKLKLQSLAVKRQVDLSDVVREALARFLSNKGGCA